MPLGFRQPSLRLVPGCVRPAPISVPSARRWAEPDSPHCPSSGRWPPLREQADAEGQRQREVTLVTPNMISLLPPRRGLQLYSLRRPLFSRPRVWWAGSLALSFCQPFSTSLPQTGLPCWPDTRSRASSGLWGLPRGPQHIKPEQLLPDIGRVPCIRPPTWHSPPPPDADSIQGNKGPGSLLGQARAHHLGLGPHQPQEQGSCPSSAIQTPGLLTSLVQPPRTTEQFTYSALGRGPV